MTAVIAIDAGTTGIRSRAVFDDDRPVVAAYREFTQHFPRPGWVEHDPAEIWEAVRATLNEVVEAVGAAEVAAIGITNQRETAVAWDRSTGKPYGNAIVWQDRRTAGRCAELASSPGVLDRVRQRTGLVLDPYFSGTKWEWLLRDGGVPVSDDLALGTVDTWLIWNLTGGEVHATDPTNASRTMLFDIRDLAWNDGLCDLLHVPRDALPTVVASSGRVGVTSDRCGARAGIPISGIAGDQQAALFGQACVRPGMAKNTYGTGSFVLLNVGSTCPEPTEGMLTTVAWTLADGSIAYALEGAIFSTGSAVQWLRDGLGVIGSAAETAPLAATVDDSAGCSSCRRSRVSGRHGGIRTRGAPSSASPAAPRRRTWQGRSSTRCHSRPVTPSRRWCAPAARRCANCAWTEGRRSWIFCSNSRPTSWASPCCAQSIRRRRPSAPPTSPAWPRVCGEIWMPWVRSGDSTGPLSPSPTAASPTQLTARGCAPSSGRAIGSSPTSVLSRKNLT